MDSDACAADIASSVAAMDPLTCSQCIGGSETRSNLAPRTHQHASIEEFTVFLPISQTDPEPGQTGLQFLQLCAGIL